MSNEPKKKYKVLLPCNGYAVGDIAELTEAEAEGFNANEPKPRVEEVKASESTPPAPPQGGEGGGESHEDAPPASPEPPAGREGEGGGSGEGGQQ